MITKGSAMSIRAKFKVTRKDIDPQSPSEFVIGLQAVTSGSPENDEFFRYTPSGNLLLQTVNKAVAAQLEIGQECYLDITPIVPEASTPAAEESAAAETAVLPKEEVEASGETSEEVPTDAPAEPVGESTPESTETTPESTEAPASDAPPAAE